MAVPKQRKTKSRRNQRRANIFIKPLTLTECLKCKKPVPSHTLCWNCGYYKNIEVVDVFKKLTKKEKKKKQKEIAAQEEQKAGKAKELSMQELSKK